MMRRAGRAGALALIAAASPLAAAAPDGPLIQDRPATGALALVAGGRALPIVIDPADHAAARRAADDLAGDIAGVTGQRPVVANDLHGLRSAIIVGTQGHSTLIDALARSGRLDLRPLAGQWESYLIATVARPLPGLDRALVIVGSDRRGTAYGVYELSRAIGVNPWTWWADLPPGHRDSIYVAPGLRRFGPPAVRYRGIFINDEDWGLQPWAAQTFDRATGDIGPKTYARVFELLLRLKANTLWPAMHKSTAAFNADPANARLADAFGIVMGSSHAEAMLRNNVGEWTAPAADYNYATNRAGVRAYWEERVRLNGGYENVWTIGMRGVHDTGLVGSLTMTQKVDLLGQVIADQRAMLDRHVPGGAAAAPQIFVPYKEVLDIYRAGLKVPDNATIVWPDDNFGYIRQFASPAEADRPGGAGVYYHLSYLGYPLAYLWLATTPPALVQEELLRAYDSGSRQFWIANVGDIKPAEIGISHFLDLAWNGERARGQTQQEYLTQWLAEAFGGPAGTRAGALMDAYFRLNFERRPEHLEWPAKGEERQLSSFTIPQANERLRHWRALAAEAAALEQGLPAGRRDAWFELVEFPIRAAAAANIRFFAAERYDELIESDPVMARSAGGAVAWAEAEIAALTTRYNTAVAGGKWRHLMPAEPADSQWRIYRPRPIVAPAPGLRTDPDRFFAEVDGAPVPATGTIEAEDSPATGWHLIEGLGRGRGALLAQRPGVSWSGQITLAPAQTGIVLGLLPLFPDATGSAQVEGRSDPRSGGRDLSVAVSIDGGPAQPLSVSRQVGGDVWAQGVLDNLLSVPVPGRFAPGPHRITVTALSSGIALDRVLPVGPAQEIAHRAQ
ncbi:MAG TPA: glycosyl hydrolase 115 family protein [Novosphingobium sp.]